MYKKTLFITTLLITIFFINSRSAMAQDLSSGTAIGIPIAGNVANGDIITSGVKGYKLSTSPYDSQLFGVVSLKPAVYFKDNTAKGDVPVISDGQVMVKVSSVNGNIQEGDFITSSTIPGIGEKATDNGFVLGRSLQSYSSNNPQASGTILVTLQPHFAQLTNNITHNIFNTFTFGLSEAVDSPLGILRYLIAGIVTLISFYFGFRFFARASNRGVEAIGRNPLAKQAILLSVFINTLITISIMFFGVAISYLILVL